MRLSNTITQNYHAYLITKKEAGNLASFWCVSIPLIFNMILSMIPSD